MSSQFSEGDVVNFIWGNGTKCHGTILKSIGNNTFSVIPHYGGLFYISSSENDISLLRKSTSTQQDEINTSSDAVTGRGRDSTTNGD